MPRQKNTKPTVIYWLYDVRLETIGAGWPDGKPFYCGKTVQKPERRLQGHRDRPCGDAGPRIIECGEHIRICVLEIVPPDQDWAAREQFGISSMRMLWPDCCLNLTNGGEGAPGWVPSAKHRAWLGAKERGKVRSPETRAKMSAAAKNRSPEHLTRLGAANRGKKRSLETRAKISAAAKNCSLETRAKMRAVQLGKKHSPEHIAKTIIARTGQKRTPEQRAKMSAVAIASGRKPSREAIENSSALRRGKKLSLETRAKMSTAVSAVWHTRKAAQ